MLDIMLWLSKDVKLSIFRPLGTIAGGLTGMFSVSVCFCSGWSPSAWSSSPWEASGGRTCTLSGHTAPSVVTSRLRGWPACGDTSAGSSRRLSARRGEPVMETVNPQTNIRQHPTLFLSTCCFEILLSLSMSVIMMETIRFILDWGVLMVRLWII